VFERSRRVYEFDNRWPDTRFFDVASLELEDLTGDGVPEIVFTTRDEVASTPRKQLHIVRYDRAREQYRDVSQEGLQVRIERARVGRTTVLMTWRAADFACQSCPPRWRVYLLRWDDGDFRVFATVESRIVNWSRGAAGAPIVVQHTKGALKRRGLDFSRELEPSVYLTTDLRTTAKHCLPLPSIYEETPHAEQSLSVKFDDFVPADCPPSVWSLYDLERLSPRRAPDSPTEPA
jgi:hypothetical protein